MFPTSTYQHAEAAIAHLAELIKDPNAGNTHSRQAAQAILNFLAKTRDLDLKERQIRLREQKHRIDHPPPENLPERTQDDLAKLAEDTEKINREYEARRRAWKMHLDIWTTKHGAAAPPTIMVAEPFTYHPIPDTYLPDPAYHGEDAYTSAAAAINHDPTPPKTVIKRVKRTDDPPYRLRHPTPTDAQLKKILDDPGPIHHPPFS